MIEQKQTVIETQGLTKKYKNFLALDNATVQVEQRDVYGLVGKNGAGKTTFFKLVMGLTRPASGNIRIAGNDNLNISRKQIGFMIGSTFFPYLSARKNMEYYRRLKGISDKSETARVLKLVGLDGVKKPFKQFSMGMKQRLGLAGALLGNPSIVFLDEPINGLDPEGISDIRNIIKALNREQGVTFVISSHVLSELDLVATRFGFIDHGILRKEISHEDLHRQTQKALIIEVDDVIRAGSILETNFGVKDYVIEKNNTIVLDDVSIRTNEIAKIFVDAGLALYSLRRRETTLEEYFMNLVVGADD
ncbi:MAG: ABC transporter ATP-binding protein [Clostridiales Family XIII bacterium]|nr:ABC transporter ATP-binding protein [Clostridiales Family XIII bacterium]